MTQKGKDVDRKGKKALQGTWAPSKRERPICSQKGRHEAGQSWVTGACPQGPRAAESHPAERRLQWAGPGHRLSWRPEKANLKTCPPHKRGVPHCSPHPQAEQRAFPPEARSFRVLRPKLTAPHQPFSVNTLSTACFLTG